MLLLDDIDVMVDIVSSNGNMVTLSIIGHTLCRLQSHGVS